MYIMKWFGWCHENKTDFYDSDGEVVMRDVDGHNIVRAHEEIKRVEGHGFNRVEYEIVFRISENWEIRITTSPDFAKLT